MRKAALLLVAALLLTCTACGQRKDQKLVSCYYVVQNANLTSQASVAAEERNLGNLSLEAFLQTYLAGPDGDGLLSPFPEDLSVLRAEQTNEGITLTLSRAYFLMMGVERSLADCCLTRTLAAYAGAKSVQLTDESGGVNLLLHADDYLVSDNVAEGMGTTYTLYFAGQNDRYLVAETRQTTLSENESAVNYMLRELLQGPTVENLLPILPVDTEVLGISEDGETCTVNFSQAFLENAPQTLFGARMTIYGVVNTLTTLETVESVVLQVEGQPLGQYGPILLEEPLVANEAAIGPVRTAGGELDVDLYQAVAGMDLLAPIPCRVAQSVSHSAAGVLMEQLLDYVPENGFYNPVPTGTTLLSLSVSSGVCYVDLSAAFLRANATETQAYLAVQAVVASLTALDDVDAVALTVAGESGGLSSVDLGRLLTVDEAFLLQEAEPSAAETE